jgi:hypothetical protein
MSFAIKIVGIGLVGEDSRSQEAVYSKTPLLSNERFKSASAIDGILEVSNYRASFSKPQEASNEELHFRRNR